MVWYSHLLKDFPQAVVIYTAKGFGVVNKAEVDVFLEFSCFLYDPRDVGDLISGSSACRTRSFVRVFFVCSGSMVQKCSEALICPILSFVFFLRRTRLNPINNITSEVNITSEYFWMEKPMRGSLILKSRKEQETVLPRALSSTVVRSLFFLQGNDFS